MPKYIDSGKRMSSAVVSGGHVYISGQVANDPDASLEEQTRQVLSKIDDHLERAGSSRSRLVMVNIFMPNISDFDAMNAVYDTWIDSSAPPARATVEARLANPSLRVEISAIGEC